MALTRITKGVIKPNENYDTHNINSTGIVTAVGANFSGNVSVGGVLTYEDVTNIDSVGVITARQGIFIDDSITHIGDTDTKIRFHANDTVSVETGGSQQLTIGSNVNIISGELTLPDTIRHRNDSNTKIRFPADDTVSIETAGSERLRITSDGKVGIGTDNPLQKLHIADNTSANIYLETKNSTTGVTAGLYYKTSSSAASDFFKTGIVLEDDGTSYARGKLHILQNNTADGSNATLSDSVVTFTQDGKVGIGTDNPNFTLEVLNNNPGLRLADKNSSAGLLSYTQLTNINGNTYVYTRANNNNGNYLIGGHGGGTFDEFIRINPSGNIGIGTNSPDGKTHIYRSSAGSVTAATDANDLVIESSANVGMSLLTANNSLARIKFGDPDATNAGAFVYNHQNDKFSIITGTGNRMIIGADMISARTDYGIARTAGGYTFREVDEGGERAGMHSDASNHLILKAGGANEYVRITHQGNVGIGTNNPVRPLHIHSADCRIRLEDAGVATDVELQNTSGDAVLTTNGLSNVRLQTNNTERLRITSSGNVGINSTTPSATLEIHDIGSTGPCVLLRGATSTEGDVTVPDGETFNFGHWNYSSSTFTERLRIDSDGDLIHTSTNKTLSLVSTQNASQAGTKIAFFGANRFDTDEEFAAIKGLLVSNSGGSGKQNGSLQFIVGSASHTHTMSQGGYVGIGTGNPQSLLHLQSDGTGGNAQGLYFKNGPHDVVRQYFNGGGDNSDFVITYEGTGGAEITLESTGNLVLNESNGGKVVIGNTAVTPTYPLTIAASGATSVLELRRTNTNSTGAIGALNFTASDGHSVANIYALGDGNNEGAHLVFKTTSAAAENSPYGSGTTERLRIKSNGYVGINTNDPLSMLDLRGDLNFNNNVLISNFDSNGVGGSNIDHIWHSDSPNYGKGGTWNFVSDTTYKATGNSVIQIGYLANSGGGHLIGDVGIGLTSISRGPLHVHENSSDDCEIHLTNNDTGTTSSDGLTIFTDTDTAGIWSREDVPFDIAVSGTRSLRFHSTGGISINTTSRSTTAMLQVDNHSEVNSNSDVGNSSQYVIVNDAHFGGTGGSLSANRSKAGIRNDLEFTSTTTSSTANGSRFSVYGIHNDINATKYAYVNDGIYSFVKSTADNQPSSSGTTTLRGVYGYAQGYLTNSQANVNTYGGYFLGYRGGDVTAGHVYGIYARAHNTNGSSNTGDLTGVYAEWEQDEGTTIANAYAFRGYGDRDAGTITNGYILYGSFGGDGSITNRWGIYINDSAKNRLGGDLEVTGALSKGSGSFRIPHPLVGLSTTKDLVHSFIEGPQCDLIYRGKVDLVGGTATINIDTKTGMTEGTFVALNRDIQCFTSNETGWTNVKGSVTGNKLTIIAQDNTCTDTISWMVVGERQDDTIKESTLTDDDGNLILEIDKRTDLNDKYQAECEKNEYNES